MSILKIQFMRAPAIRSMNAHVQIVNQDTGESFNLAMWDMDRGRIEQWFRTIVPKRQEDTEGLITIMAEVL